MTDKQKESQQAEAILAILFVGVPLVAIAIGFVYFGFGLHPLIGLWFAASEIALVNFVLKKKNAFKENSNNDN